MKYGIRITAVDGDVKYAYTAKGGHISVTTDITETALFAQEESAVKAVKQARKLGYESANNVALDVIGITFSVVQVTEVPQPPKKQGFVLTAILTNKWKPTSYPCWFSGPRKQGSDLHWAQAIESATVFPSDLDAQAKIAECREAHELVIKRTETELTRGGAGYYSLSEKQAWLKRTRDSLADKIEHRQWFDTIRIEPV